MKNWIKNNIHTTISIATLLVIAISWKLMDMFASTENFPIGYYQKIPYAVLYAILGIIIMDIIMRVRNPKAYNDFDELTDGGVNDLPNWERAKVYMWKATIFIALLIAGIMS